MPHKVSCPIVFCVHYTPSQLLKNCQLFLPVHVYGSGNRRYSKLVIVYAGGKWSSEAGKINVLYKGLYECINVCNEYYISLSVYL